MVPAAMLMLLLDLSALARGLARASTGADGVLRSVGVLAVCAFYALIIWSYLRRGPAVATGRSAVASVVAVLATFAPFTFPLLRVAPPGTAQPGTVRQVAADTLLVAGTAFAAWSLRFLGRNLSVIAQARGVAERGPYRLVRHPLYAGELVSAFGLALAAGTVAAFAVWAALVAMQVYRAVQEERVLLRALPGYQEYRARTSALLPGLF